MDIKYNNIIVITTHNIVGTVAATKEMAIRKRRKDTKKPNKNTDPIPKKPITVSPHALFTNNAEVLSSFKGLELFSSLIITGITKIDATLHAMPTNLISHFPTKLSLSSKVLIMRPTVPANMDHIRISLIFDRAALIPLAIETPVPFKPWMISL
jgi:hypothetical protein